MRKLVYYFIGLILIGLAVAVGIGAARSSKSHNDNTSNTTAAKAKPSPNAKKACDIFTLADAKQLLGDTARGGDNTIAASSDDLAVTTCSYIQSSSGSNSLASTDKTASLLVRTPRTEKGAVSNQNEFGALKPQGVQDVSGYGDSAYWDAQRGVLNILKNNSWYIINYGPVTPADRTLDQTKQLADILLPRL